MSWIKAMFVALIVGASLWNAGPAAGEGMTDVWPVLRTLPAPPWVKEGVRLSYYSRALSVPSVTGSYVRDDNGDWVGQTTGDRYRWEDAPAPGGHGVTQVDIVSLDARSVVLGVNAFQYYNVTGPLIGVQQGCEVGVPAAGSDYWVHPRALQQIPQRLGPGLKIVRMPFRLGDRTIQTLRIQRETSLTRHVYMFDLQTGMLVHMNGAAQDAGGKATLCTDMTLLGVRQLDPPWARDPLPEWLGRGASMRFSGKHTNTVTVPQPHPYSVPLTGTVQVTARNHNSAIYDQTITMTVAQGMPPHIDRRTLATGAWQLGGIGLPPQGLARLRPNQVIDRDEVTKVRTIVKAAGTGASGRRTVVLQASNEAGGVEMTYDVATGAVISVAMTQGVSYFHRSRTELALTGMTAGAAPRRPPGAGRPPPTAPKPGPEPPLPPVQAASPGPKPEAARDWDELGASVIDKLAAENLNIGTYVRVLKSAECRIALRVTPRGSQALTAAIRYAWDDANDDGKLSATEVRITAQPVDDASFQRLLDGIVSDLVTMTTTDTHATFRPYRVRTRASDEGFELTLTPLDGSASGGRMTVAPDFRILHTKTRDTFGNDITVDGRHVRLAAAWLPEKSSKTVLGPEGERVGTQTLTNAYRMQEGVPMARRTVMVQTAAVQGETLELEQEYLFLDWKIVKRTPGEEAVTVLEPAMLVGTWSGPMPGSKRWVDWVLAADGTGVTYISERRKVQEHRFRWSLAGEGNLKFVIDVSEGQTAELLVRCERPDARTLLLQETGGPERYLTRLADNRPGTLTEQRRTLVGTWRDMHSRHKEDTLEFGADRRFKMVRTRSYGSSYAEGDYVLDEGGRLEILADGKDEPLVSEVRFLDADTYIAVSPKGEGSRVVRLGVRPRH